MYLYLNHKVSIFIPFLLLKQYAFILIFLFLFPTLELSNSVWALATAGMIPKYTKVFDTTLYPSKTLRDNYSYISSDPLTQCFAAVGMEAIRRPHAFKEQEIKDVLWSFSKASIRHPILFRKVAEHLVGDTTSTSIQQQQPRGLERFQPQGIGNLVYAYARQALLAADSNQNTASSSSSSSNNGSSSNGRLAVYETSCLDVGESLINRLFTCVANTCSDDLSKFKPQDLSNTAWSFATLGLLHRPFFEKIAQQTSYRLQTQLKKSSSSSSSKSLNMQFKAQEITNLVWSFATLNFKNKDVLDDISNYLYEGVISYSKNKNTNLFPLFFCTNKLKLNIHFPFEHFLAYKSLS